MKMDERISHLVGQNEPNVDEVITRKQRVKLEEHFHKLKLPTYAGIEGSEMARESSSIV